MDRLTTGEEHQGEEPSEWLYHSPIFVPEFHFGYGDCSFASDFDR